MTDKKDARGGSTSRRKLTIYLTTGLILLAVLSVVFFIIFYLTNISSEINDKETAEDRNYHILVIGNSENASFLTEVYNGAQEVSQSYNSIVELYVPESRAEDISFQELLDYASYTNADGIIAYIDSTTTVSEYPQRIDETPIPIITIGQYSPAIRQVSYIGHNYSEAGKRIAEETLSLSTKDSKICVVNNSGSFNTNYSTLMNSFQNVLRQKQFSNLTILDEQSQAAGQSIQQYLVANSKQDVVLVCLTEDDIIQTCQLLISFGLENKVKLVGFGSNEVVEWYFDRGIITELVTVDSRKIGQEALRELFEYRSKGYANSFVTADVEIRKHRNETK